MIEGTSKQLIYYMGLYKTVFKVEGSNSCIEAPPGSSEFGKHGGEVRSIAKLTNEEMHLSPSNRILKKSIVYDAVAVAWVSLVCPH